ncbi:MAG TPA: PAS domain-containing protein [Ideonella sp.]|nr:PAS domain-containing protein [Ideonella sp.]
MRGRCTRATAATARRCRSSGDRRAWRRRARRRCPLTEPGWPSAPGAQYCARQGTARAFRARRTVAQLEHVIDDLPTGISILDREFRIEYVNAAFSHMLGWTEPRHCRFRRQALQQGLLVAKIQDRLSGSEATG